MSSLIKYFVSGLFFLCRPKGVIPRDVGYFVSGLFFLYEGVDPRDAVCV